MVDLLIDWYIDWFYNLFRYWNDVSFINIRILSDKNEKVVDSLDLVCILYRVSVDVCYIYIYVLCSLCLVCDGYVNKGYKSLLDELLYND